MNMNTPSAEGLPTMPEPAAILERTWRGGWFAGRVRLDASATEEPVYTADQMRTYGEQCRAASVEDSAVNAVLTMIRRERDAWLSWNHDHPEQAAVTTPDVLEMAANLIRALSRGVPEGK